MLLLKKLIKNTIYYAGSLPIIKNLTWSFKGRAAILCYHRVVNDKYYFNEKSPQQNLLVTIENFDKHMYYLSKNHQVVSMDELAQHLISDSDEFKVAITFDDGYNDNLINALPILEKYRLPATIYICTRFPENDCEMWWYGLWDLIQKEEKISLIWKESNFILATKTYSQKLRAYKILSRLFEVEDYQTQKELITKLFNNNYLVDYVSLCLSWDDIIKLSKNPLITIGSHGHTHCSLSHLEEENVYWELEYSKKIIEEKINQTVNHLAYPFGTKNNVSTRDHIIARKCKYKTAVETTVKVLNKGNKLYSLPRLSVRNTNSFVIDAKLNGVDNLIYSLM